MVSTVHDAIAREIKTHHCRQGGVHIHRMDNFIGLLSRRYFPGPANQKGNAKGPFVAGKKATSPGAVESFSFDSPIAPVVRSKDENGVVLDP